METSTNKSDEEFSNRAESLLDCIEILSGMVFTVEPGLYNPDLGGFRRSDTVAVMEGGIEILTYYPRDLKGLTIPI